jgi:hypothetical protein
MPDGGAHVGPHDRLMPDMVRPETPEHITNLGES